MNKLVTFVFAVSAVCVSGFGLVGCAGAGDEGPIAFPSGSRGGSGMDDSSPARMHTASREAPTRDATPNMHALRHDGDFVICAQCRR